MFDVLYTGRKLFMLCLSPFLYIGFMYAVFSMFGKSPVSKDVFICFVSFGAIMCLISLSISVGMSNSPIPLFLGRSDIILHTSVSFVSSSVMLLLFNSTSSSVVSMSLFVFISSKLVRILSSIESLKNV
uniref:Uncharacterized protein n=1 Tax=Cacopsylla melanoneura TaxID=428564 RepID=A0A8D9DY00_9HEMI